ncbi:MAG: hypothetical protein JW819_08165, partial [Candidatus Krumholzibacteriota bacterium]|nr:hypothetical protein [Candidatus Krumholzibacteriota bacterium]
MGHVFEKSISRHLMNAILLIAFASTATAIADPVIKGPPAETVVARAGSADPEFAALVEALRAARRAGDEERVRSLCAELDRMRAVERIAPEAPAEAAARFVRRAELAGRGDPLADDIQVNLPQWTTKCPAMASTSDGVLYLVGEDTGVGAYYLDIYFSTNDGYTWDYWVSLYSVYDDLTNPSIAIGEGNANRLLVAYESGRDTADAAIYVAWLDLDTGQAEQVLVESHPYWLGDPQICVDSSAYSNWWPYLVYTKGTFTKQSHYDLLFCRSFDYGESWEAPAVLAADVSPDCRADIDFGDPGLYVAYTRYADGYENDIYLLRSTSLGSSWDAEVALAHHIEDETDPRVAATKGGGAVVVAFSREYSGGNTDIEACYSQDGGYVWNLTYLPWTSYPEAKVDLEVSQDLDRIHAAFYCEHDVLYTWATWDDPGSWAPAAVVNHGGTAAYGMRPTVAVNPSKEQEACFAWADTRVELQYHVYFNAAYPLGDYQIILADAGLIPAVEPLVLWKQALGYNVDVVDLATILAYWPGIDDAEKIWNCLHDFRDQIKYVLLVGDVDLIPMRVLYPDGDPAYPPSDPMHHNGYGYGTDYYYAEHTVTDWDLDGDNRWGEFTDDAFDHHPDMLVGRIPFNEVAPVQAVCSNIVTFEQDTGAWKRDVLMAHGFLAQPASYTLPGADCAAMADYARANLITPLGWSATTLFERSGIGYSAYGCTAGLSQANYEYFCGPQAFGAVNCAAHGDGVGIHAILWKYDLNGSGYCDLGEEWCYNTYSQRGQIPAHPAQSVVYLNGCATAPPFGKDDEFNASPLRSLYLIRIPSQDVAFKDYLLYGAPGVIGSSAGSEDAPVWSSPNDGGSSSLAYYYYENLIAGDLPVGDAFHGAAHTFAAIHGPQRPMRVFNYYGDPSLRLQGVPAGKAGAGEMAGRAIPGYLAPDAALAAALDWRRDDAPDPDAGAGDPVAGARSRIEASIWTECAELPGATVVTSLVPLPGGAVMGTGIASYDTAGTQALLVSSPDGWDPWMVAPIPGMHSARTIHRTDAGTLLVGGMAGALPDEPVGVILRSVDGGENWAACHEIGGGMVTDFCQDMDGKLWACCGLNGQIHSSVDDGATWMLEIAFSDGPHLTSIMQASTGRYFVTLAFCSFSVLWSDDGTAWYAAGGLGATVSGYAVGETGGYLYVGVEETGGAWVYRSVDLNGEFWSRAPGFPVIEGGLAVQSLAVDSDGRIYAGVAMEPTKNATSVHVMHPDEGVWRTHGGIIDLADRITAILPRSGVVTIGTGSFHGNVYRCEGPVLTDVPDDGQTPQP